MKTFIPVIFLGLFVALFLLPPTFAQGPAPDTASVFNSQYNFLANIRPSDYVTTAINIFLGLAGVAAFIYLLWGGVQWVTSGGDKDAIEKSRKRIMHALIGLAIVFSAYALILIIQILFGISTIWLPLRSIGGNIPPMPTYAPPPTRTPTPPAGAPTLTPTPTTAAGLPSPTPTAYGAVDCSVSFSPLSPTLGSNVSLTINTNSTILPIRRVFLYWSDGSLLGAFSYSGTNLSTTMTITGNSYAAVSFLNNIQAGSYAFYCGVEAFQTPGQAAVCYYSVPGQPNCPSGNTASFTINPAGSPQYVSTTGYGTTSGFTCTQYCTTHGFSACTGSCTTTSACNSQANNSWEISIPGSCAAIGSSWECGVTHLGVYSVGGTSYNSYCCCQ